MVDEGEEWVKGKVECFEGKVSYFFVLNDFVIEFNENKIDIEFFFECIVYEDVYGLDIILNVFKVS